MKIAKAACRDAAQDGIRASQDLCRPCYLAVRTKHQDKQSASESAWKSRRKVRKFGCECQNNKVEGEEQGFVCPALEDVCVLLYQASQGKIIIRLIFTF